MSMTMTAKDWMDSDERVSRTTAIHWITQHGFTFYDFSAMYGNWPTYQAADVFSWMGY